MTQSYTQACLNCSKSKCKCVSGPGTHGCERCRRLKKNCIPGKAMRSRNTESSNSIHRIAILEDKIDSLVSHLESNRVMKPVASSTPQPYTGLPMSLDPTTASRSASIPTESTLDYSPEECLAEFRGKMLKYFPFMHLPYDAKWLSTHRPFLFTCIKAASLQQTKVKVELGEEIKETLIRRIYFDNDRNAVNLDLLLGLLTFIAWGHDNLLQGTAARVSRFTQLAMTLVFSLRLNKPAPQESNMLPMDKPCSSSDVPARTLEERRAILGCFVLSSIVSSYFSQIDTMQWTPYMDECVEALTESNESVYDEMFIQQVKLQRVALDIEDIKETHKVPAAFYSAGLRHRVNHIKNHMSSQLFRDGECDPGFSDESPLTSTEIMLSSIYYTELSISGLMLCNKNLPNSQELESLHECLSIIRSALENFFRIPISEYHGMSFPFFIQLARTIVVLIKLSTSRDAFWDSTLVSGTIDVLQVMDRLLDNIHEAKTMIGDQGKDGFLDKASKIFASVRSWCSSNLPRKIGVGNVVCDRTLDNGQKFEDLFLDDAWLKDYLVL
ncbi:hypothetical protein N7490_004432 [Penicillium lividum]|nr:hypothetical protein N7490_004432 [Penicillium lividum]